MSRLSLAHDYGRRPSLFARMLIQGPAGSGKTLTALKVAKVLSQGAPILGIDTEGREMLCYRDDYDFTHLSWLPPFEPDDLGSTLIEAGSEYAVIIVDSFSHFWNGEGGTLSVAEGKFTGWKEARPIQNRIVDSMRRTRAHVILCTRTRTDWSVTQDGPRQRVVRLGTAPVQDSAIDYEVNVSLDVSADHQLTVIKSRTTEVPVNRVYGPDSVEELADTYSSWLHGGEPLVADAQLEAIQRAVAVLGEGQRSWLQGQWRLKGLPVLRVAHESDVPRIEALISEAARMDITPERLADAN